MRTSDDRVKTSSPTLPGTRGERLICRIKANTNIQISKSQIVFISFATHRKKLFFDPDVFISSRGKPLAALRSEIIAHLPAPSPNSKSSKSLHCDLIVPILTLLRNSHNN